MQAAPACVTHLTEAPTLLPVVRSQDKAQIAADAGFSEHR